MWSLSNRGASRGDNEKLFLPDKKKFKSSEKNSVINVVPIRKTWGRIAQSV